MVIGQILNLGIRYGSRYLKQLHKYDVSIHKGLYGATAGRGVRHGRDAGIFISQYIKGDELDRNGVSPKQPRNGSPASKKYQTYSRRFRNDNRRNEQYCRPNRYRAKSRYN